MANEADLVAEVATQMPPVSPQIQLSESPAPAGPQATAPAAGSESPAAGTSEIKRDIKGTAFDPAIHRKNPDGSPKVKKDGTFEGKGGRPRKPLQPARRPPLVLPKDDTFSGAEAAGMPGEQAAAGALPAQPVEAKPVDPAVFQALGKITAGLIFTAGALVFGEDGKPMKDEATGIDEGSQMAEAWAVYYQATGATEISPGALVCIVTAQYAAVRLAKPKPRERVALIFAWLRSRFFR